MSLKIRRISALQKNCQSLTTFQFRFELRHPHSMDLIPFLNMHTMVTFQSVKMIPAVYDLEQPQEKIGKLTAEAILQPYC